MADEDEYEWYYEDEDDEYEYYEDATPTSPQQQNQYGQAQKQKTNAPVQNVQNALKIMQLNYTQQLLVNPQDLKINKDEEQKRQHLKKQQLMMVDGFSSNSRQRNRSRHHSGNNMKKQSPNMTAINVLKALFKGQHLQQVQIDPADLKGISSILENIICGASSIPTFIITLFQTICNNMFGTLEIDFNLLNGDYLPIKNVFVDGGNSNNSSIRFQRIMTLINNAKNVSSVHIKNIHLAESSLNCIIEYIGNDANYDDDNLLKNSVNTIMLHRKSGLKYNQIEATYAKLFEACGWKLSFDANSQSVVITLNVTANWEYFDENFDEDAKESKVQNADNADDEYEYYYEEDDNAEYEYYDEPATTKQPKQPSVPKVNKLKSSKNSISPIQTAPMVTKMTSITPKVKSPVKSHKITQKPPMQRITTPAAPDDIDLPSNYPPQMMNLVSLPFDGLPPPDFDSANGPDDSDKNKAKFLGKLLTKKDYIGRNLFNFNEGMLNDIIEAMQRMDVKKGHCIMKETEYGQNYDLKFFVIEYGVFNMYQSGKKLPKELVKKQTFGENHLIYGIPSYVTIRAVTNKCLVWCLQRSTYYQISWKYFHKPFDKKLKTQLNEFDVITTLGVGSFGKVLLVRDPTDNRTYSLKQIAKNNVIQNGQQQHIMNERSVLALISRTDQKVKRKNGKKKRKKETFCCQLFGLYQDKFYLYFLMEPLLGGELFTLLRHNKKFSEKVARFYLSCIILAFDHLHSLNIIYRDIKPENIMLSSNGYVKLVDFGLAKLRNNTVTQCGTPEYLAPEVIQNYWQGFELDWWGLGILLFEMTYGHPPFASYEDILGKHPFQIHTPPLNAPHLVHLINSLLLKNPYIRLGTTANGRKGVEEIYAHKWFEGTMEWKALKAQKFRPPYVPDIENDEDVSNFEEIEPDDHGVKKKNETPLGDDKLYQWCQYF